jgi:1-acyl-sn-glycerol-3-phosphate acyltransferase
MDILKSLVVWLIGLVFMVILFPATFLIWLILLPFDRKRSIIHRILIYQSSALTRLIPIWKTDITGIEKASDIATYVIFSNHQSILDILMINCLRLRFKWISKIENSRVPFLGWYLKMARYITVDRSDDESKAVMLEKSLQCLKNGTSIMIFPEGTRSLDSEVGFFKRGAFQLAIQAGVPLLPVIIDGTGGILPKHGLIFSGGHKITVRVLDPVQPSSFGTDDPEILAMKMHSLIASNLMDIRSKDSRK